jgi:hypothetical protein
LFKKKEKILSTQEVALITAGSIGTVVAGVFTFFGIKAGTIGANAAGA